MVAEGAERQAAEVADPEEVARFIIYQRQRDRERQEAVRSFIATLLREDL